MQTAGGPHPRGLDALAGDAALRAVHGPDEGFPADFCPAPHGLTVEAWTRTAGRPYSAAIAGTSS